MKVTCNGYTRLKLNNAYRDMIPEVVRILLRGYAYEFEKNDIETGEPAIFAAQHMYGFYLCGCTFVYDTVKDKVGIALGQVWHNTSDPVSKENIEYYPHITSDMIKTLIDYRNEKYKPDLEKSITKINSYLKYEKDWNGYNCNIVATISVENAIDLFTYLYNNLKLNEVHLNSYASADGGNSTVIVDMENGYRKCEFECEANGKITALFFEHQYHNDTNSELTWPQEYWDFGEEYWFNKDFANDPLLQWLLPWIHYENL